MAEKTLFALIAALLLVACVPAAPPTVVPPGTERPTPTPTPRPSPTPTPPPARLTLEALKNAEYMSPMDPQVKVRLSNGVYVAPSPAGPRITLLEETVRFGDLNGDGREDAALVLNSDTGGTGQFRTLVAVLDQGGVPVHVASASLGDRVRITSITVQGGTITVDLVTHGPQDPLCCPTLQKVVRYRLVGGQLVEG
jgi:hypothetical protein